MKRTIWLFALIVGASVQAATFIVPADRTMVRRADAIVIARVLGSHSEITTSNGIETVTELMVDATLKGKIDDSGSIVIHEPGGVIRNRALSVPGVPRFRDGERDLLFLTRTPAGQWAITDIALGRFTFATDALGRDVLLRAENEISGWNADGTSHQPQIRASARFIEFIRAEVAGGKGGDGYFVAADTGSAPKKPVLTPSPSSAFSATSYTADVQYCPGSGCGGGAGARWNSFPQSIYVEPGTSTTLASAVTTAVNNWRGSSGAGIGYVAAGTEACSPSCHTGGFSGADGLNTVLWERDLSAYGIAPLTCSSSGAGGILGIGGITATNGTHAGPDGATFFTTSEVDVEMNVGIAACVGTGLATADLNTAVAHEIGLTLGFRNADQTRADDPTISCDTDGTLDCAGTAQHSAAAVMSSVLPTALNGALQPWDVNAAAALYPAAALAAPTGVLATATKPTSGTTMYVHVAWNAVSGASSYNVYRYGNSNPIATGITATWYDDTSAPQNTAMLYYVCAVSGSSVSANSAMDLATTVYFDDDPLCLGFGNPLDPPLCSGAPPTPTKATHINELVTAVNAVAALAGTSPVIDCRSGSPKDVACMVTNMRAALAAARARLNLPALTFTDPTIYAVGNAQNQPPTKIRKTHIAELRAGVQ